MLGPGRYLLGVLEIVLLIGFAWLGARSLRARLLPRFEGAPAHLAAAVIALALLIWVAEVLGALGLFKPGAYLAGVVAVGGGIWGFGRWVGPRGGGGGRGGREGEGGRGGYAGGRAAGGAGGSAGGWGLGVVRPRLRFDLLRAEG